MSKLNSKLFKTKMNETKKSTEALSASSAPTVVVKQSFTIYFTNPNLFTQSSHRGRSKSLAAETLANGECEVW